MTWLYIPNRPKSHCSPELPALPSVCRSLSLDYEPCVTLNGKPERRPLSWREWKNRPWIRRLSGMTLPPSTADRLAAEWISSLPVSPVSRGATPGSAKGSTTTDGCGNTLRGWFAKWDPESCSWRTSQVSLLEEALIPFSDRWPRSGSMRSGMCFQPEKSGRRTSASGFSSWPTPRACEGDKWSAGKQRKDSLTQVSKGWPTPRAIEANGGDYQNQKGGGSLPTLTGAARLRHTPRAIYGEHNGITDPKHLTGQALSWPTPNASDVKGASQPAGRRRPSDDDLPSAVIRYWPTPAARDGKGANSAKHLEVGAGRKHLDQLPNFVAHNFPLPPPDPSTSTNGGASSPSTRRLNPRFVEWLMGWPIGWTDYDSAATGFTLWRRRMRSALLRLVPESNREAA